MTIPGFSVEKVPRDRAPGARLLLSALLMLATAVHATPARAQATVCTETPEGRICKVTQELRQGVLVPVERQRELGLVTVGGGCSGTLVNRRWVLTADHCVTSTGTVNGPSAALDALPIRAAWSSRVPRPTRLVRNWGAGGLDVALIFLGATDFGQVNTQSIFVGDIENGMTLTKYGQGIFEYASAGPPAVPARQDGRYRSARFTSSNATALGYDLAVNTAGQVGEGGDSGGPDVVTAPNGIGLGIAGVQSTCSRPAGGVVPGKTVSWLWTTAISLCSSAATSTIRFDLLQIIQEGMNSCPNQPAGCALSAVEQHVDGKLWRWDGRTPCTGTACPGWMLIDANPSTQQIAATGDALFERHADGKLWKWDGRTPCNPAVTACPGWTLIDANPRTQAITAGGDTVFQRHVDGKLWKWDGGTPCNTARTACPGWTLIDANPRTREIAAAGDTLFQRQVDGTLWKWDGRTPCNAAVTACPGWALIDMNPRTQAIAATGDTVFQRHVDGKVWRWDGHTPCNDAHTACPGWTLIDMNPRTQEITAAGGTVFQRHVDGKLWRWDGRTPCNAAHTACPGWTLIDMNPRTQEVVAGGPTVFQRHVDGKLWKWDGSSVCNAAGTACPGWTLMDQNPRTTTLVPFGPIRVP